MSLESTSDLTYACHGQWACWDQARGGGGVIKKSTDRVHKAQGQNV